MRELIQWQILMALESGGHYFSADFVSLRKYQKIPLIKKIGRIAERQLFVSQLAPQIF